ncbi:MAG TPA: hypothetical protein DCE41_07280 [Cytophagales bacterium]|nr:hypothetical protein [Cytophagales bacterium]HAA19592.1 hypothetical protein [Cytophagales bacterium]HAP64556.1 hypothetical protein [Cytophagales bacterium]
MNSALLGKLVQFRLTEGRIAQRVWGLYTGLMWVPMVLLVTALLTWRRQADVTKTIPYLVAFIFALLAITVLLAYPG